MIKTDFFWDSIHYYNKAKQLQKRNLGELPKDFKVNDPIMDYVGIFDNVNRRYAGFCKALEDIMDTRHPVFERRFQVFRDVLDIRELHFLFWFHRFTGSGASFEPRYLPDGTLNPREHGYCNSLLEDVAKIIKTDGIPRAMSFIANVKTPFVTSKGNQPPSLKNKYPDRYRLATQYYFDNFAADFIEGYIEYLYSGGRQKGIKEAVDWCLDWHSERGFKRWKFVVTAFVMDSAEYYPQLVDPTSHVYYGSNCIRSMDLCFEKEKSDKYTKQEWYEKCMEQWVEETGGRPFELEDAPGCDVIRYWKEYVPNGYEHLEEWQKKNNSLLKINGKYEELNQKRLDRILGK